VHIGSVNLWGWGLAFKEGGRKEISQEFHMNKYSNSPMPELTGQISSRWLPVPCTLREFSYMPELNGQISSRWLLVPCTLRQFSYRCLNLTGKSPLDGYLFPVRYVNSPIDAKLNGQISSRWLLFSVLSCPLISPQAPIDGCGWMDGLIRCMGWKDGWMDSPGSPSFPKMDGDGLRPIY
jgi:hypothetical protein